MQIALIRFQPAPAMSCNSRNLGRAVLRCRHRRTCWGAVPSPGEAAARLPGGNASLFYDVLFDNAWVRVLLGSQGRNAAPKDVLAQGKSSTLLALHSRMDVGNCKGRQQLLAQMQRETEPPIRTLPRTSSRRSGDRTTMLRMLMHAWRCTHRASLASAAPSMPPMTCESLHSSLSTPPTCASAMAGAAGAARRRSTIALTSAAHCKKLCWQVLPQHSAGLNGRV